MKRQNHWIGILIFAIIVLVVGLIWFPPTKARADGYRTDITRSGRNITITERQTYYDDGFRYLRHPAPPNACDDMGLKGIEAVTGPDAGTCYPSVIGRR